MTKKKIKLSTTNLVIIILIISIALIGIKETYEGIGDSRLFPSILVIAGGAYTNVSKRETEPVALKFLAENYNAFVLE
jgi:hypothetical protein